MVISPPLLVGSASNFTAGGLTTLAATITQNTNGGHLFIVCGGNRSSTVSITDPRSNTVTNDINTASGANTQFSIHRIPIVTNYATSDSFTATWSVSSPNRFMALFYVTNVNTIDQSIEAGGTALAWATGAINTTHPYQLLLGGCTLNTNAQTTNTPTSPWIELHDTNTTDSVNFCVQYQMSAKTSSYNCQGTWAAGTAPLTRMGVASYKAIPSGKTSNNLRPAIFSPGLAR